MTEIFDITIRDIWIFGRYATLKKTSFKLKLAMNMAMFFLAVLLYGAWSRFKVFETILLAAVLTAGYVYVQFKVLKTKITKAYSSKGGYVGSHTLDIEQDGIRETLPAGVEFHKWSEYMEIVEYKGYLYLLWGDNAANIVPVKAFGTDAEKLEFVKTVQQNMKKMKEQ